MFDFEKLDVYQVVKEQHNKVFTFLKANPQIDTMLLNNWKEASLNIVLNLSQGTGRKNPIEKKEFLTLSRGFVFEAATILQIVKDLGLIDEENYQDIYDGYEKSSKMLLGMFRSYNRRDNDRGEYNKEYNKDYNNDFVEKDYSSSQNFSESDFNNL